MHFAYFILIALVGAHARPNKRQASCSFPDATDTISLDEPMTITGSFDVSRGVVIPISSYRVLFSFNSILTPL